ncbi:MAG: hypothetical protein GY811_03445 [Myxococcales bacterium]|nr:hypothetical protein [Myxococcales bacterium]
MFPLLAASLLWAFFFGLIKGELTGLDPQRIALIRLALAALAFSRLVIRGREHWRQGTRAMGLGAVQFGLMYVLYIASYRYLGLETTGSVWITVLRVNKRSSYRHLLPGGRWPMGEGVRSI